VDELPRHLTADWLQHHEIDVSIEIAGRAVEAVAYDRRFHPVREYLIGLKWDGECRIDTWLEKYCGAKPVEASPTRGTPYLAAVGAKWLISAVARVMKPGCKADCALVLEGAQGLRKSSTLKVLGGEWFTDQLEQMRSKDASLQTHGVWIIEIAELASMTKSEVEDVKAFMSRPAERYRPPYAGRLVNIPRQCIFGGTVNVDTWNRDETGARRFWPVTCGVIRLNDLERDRDQLWAEARFRFDEGSLGGSMPTRLSVRPSWSRAARYREDPWHERVRNFLYSHGLSTKLRSTAS
jgi:predicted P-loop ATPase